MLAQETRSGGNVVHEQKLEQRQDYARDNLPKRSKKGNHCNHSGGAPVLDLVLCCCLFEAQVLVRNKTGTIVRQLPVHSFNTRWHLHNMEDPLNSRVWILPSNALLVACVRKPSALRRRVLEGSGYFDGSAHHNPREHSDLTVVCLCGGCTLQPVDLAAHRLGPPIYARCFQLSEVQRAWAALRHRQHRTGLSQFRPGTDRARVVHGARLDVKKAKIDLIMSSRTGPKARFRLHAHRESLSEMLTRHSLPQTHNVNIPPHWERRQRRPRRPDRPAGQRRKQATRCRCKPGKCAGCACVTAERPCSAMCHPGATCRNPDVRLRKETTHRTAMGP